MYEIHTASGARYVIANGRITRQADHAIQGVDQPITNMSFRFRNTPEVGGMVAFDMPAAPDISPIRTSRIVAIVR